MTKSESNFSDTGTKVIIAFYKGVLAIFVAYICLYLPYDWVRQPYKEVRFYEKWGLYTPKLTLEQWNRRVSHLNPTQVHEMLGTPVEEKSRIPEIEFLWKYKLPLTSAFEDAVITDKFVYVWFTRARGDNRFYCIGIVDHFPD